MTPARLDANLELEADSWAFALRIYALPGVADACLELQDRAGVDVMVLLVTAYAAVRHRLFLARLQIHELDAACRSWREQIVQPLRAIRTRLKSGPQPAPSRDTEPFRSAIKAAELVAERLQHRLLVERLRPQPPPREPVSRQDLRDVLASVVTLALERGGGEPVLDLQSSIEVIVEAAMQEAP
jgi:uncharacterized protein (TIGR02444 family)